MSAHNFFDDAKPAETPDAGQIGTPAVDAWGPTVPTDGTPGYIHGCTFKHTDGTANTDALYSNISTVTSCQFELATVAAS